MTTNVIKQPAKPSNVKNKPDTRKQPAPGYPENNPQSQKDIKQPVKQPK